MTHNTVIINGKKNNKKIIGENIHKFQSNTIPQLSLELCRQIIANKRESQQKIAEKYGFHNQSSLARFLFGFFIPKKRSTRERYAKIFDVDISLFSKFCDELLEKKENEGRI